MERLLYLLVSIINLAMNSGYPANSVASKYAIRRPDMCRFLLQNGADAERFAPLPGDLDSRAGTPLAIIHFGGSSSEHRQDMETCVRLMVNAGCDPEVSAALIGHPGRRTASPVEYVCLAAAEVRAPQTCDEYEENSMRRQLITTLTQ